MAGVFAITAATTTVRTDAQGRGDASFTVSNVSGRPLQGRVELRPGEAAQAGWFSVAGDVQRAFVPNGTHQISVKIAVPAGTPPRKVSFRIDVVSPENPDEDFAEGPTITVEAVAPAPAKAPFPWWIVAAVAALLLVVGGIGAYLVLRQPAEAAASSAPVAPATPVARPPSAASPPAQASTPPPAATPPPPTMVPDLAGRPRDAATQALQALGLTVSQRYKDAVAAQDSVLALEPAPGTAVSPGSVVTLVLANALVDVPNVVGTVRAAAADALGAKGLAVRESRENSTTLALDTVIRQDPPAGRLVKAGTPVQVVLADTVCAASHVTLGNDVVFLYLDLPESKVGTKYSWKEVVVNTYKFPRCYRVGVSNGYSYTCEANGRGAAWKASGDVLRDAACHPIGSPSQPFMRAEIK